MRVRAPDRRRRRWPVVLWMVEQRGDGTDLNYRFQAGFVLLFSNDGFAHGTLTPAGRRPVKPSCNGGIDPWIAQHWPQAFPRGIGWTSNTLPVRVPPGRIVYLVDAGFPASQFTALNGHDWPMLTRRRRNALLFRYVFSGKRRPRRRDSHTVRAGGGSVLLTGRSAVCARVPLRAVFVLAASPPTSDNP